LEQEPLSDPQEILFRQVHPSFLRDGRPSSQAFRPTKKDGGELSVARGCFTTAQDAYEHHTEKLGLQSAGTWGVLVGECLEADLKTFGDPIGADRAAVPDAAHAFIDFRNLSGSQVEARGAKLVRHANQRGSLYTPC
jgi:hypothetical protein